MGRELFGLELGQTVYAENGDALFSVIGGTAAPDGVSGKQGDVNIGSLYVRSGTGELYQKIANAGAPGDWLLNGSASGSSVISGGYTPANGDVTSGDTYEEAFEKLDGNQIDLISLTGVLQGAVDLGTFTGGTIPDNQDIKAAFQALETAYEETDQNVDDLITLSGVAENATDLGTFTGDIISDNVDNKTAMQELETELVETRDNTDDLVTLSGVAENATDLGTFTGNTIQDNRDNKEALQDLETAVEGTPQTETGVSSATVLDQLLVDEYRSAVWLVTAFDEANPADVKSAIVHGANDGTSGGDAANIDDNVSSLLVKGAFNTQIAVVLNGTGAAQEMRLEVNSSEPGVTFTAVRMGAAPSGY